MIKKIALLLLVSSTINAEKYYFLFHNTTPHPFALKIEESKRDGKMLFQGNIYNNHLQLLELESDSNPFDADDLIFTVGKATLQKKIRSSKDKQEYPALLWDGLKLSKKGASLVNSAYYFATRSKGYDLEEDEDSQLNEYSCGSTQPWEEKD